jgi:hypothetical protein
MVALYTVSYNFTKIHKMLTVAPAMAAGITGKLMSMEDIANLIDAAAPKPGRLRDELVLSQSALFAHIWRGLNSGPAVARSISLPSDVPYAQLAA